MIDNIKAESEEWHSRGKINQWVTIQFPYYIQLDGFRVKRPNGWDNSGFKEYVFQVSADEGVIWTDVYTGTGVNQQCCDFQTITFDTPTSG